MSITIVLVNLFHYNLNSLFCLCSFCDHQVRCLLQMNVGITLKNLKYVSSLQKSLSVGDGNTEEEDRVHS